MCLHINFCPILESLYTNVTPLSLGCKAVVGFGKLSTLQDVNKKKQSVMSPFN